MIKIGNIEITDVKLGNTQVNQVYLGSTLLWEVGGDEPPEGYEWCNYIENTSSAYINTGVNPNGNTKFKADIEISAAYTYLFGARNGTSAACYMVSNNGGSNKAIFRYNTGQGTGLAANAITGRCNLEVRGNVLYVNGVSTVSRTAATFTTNYPLYIYAYNGSGSIVGKSYAKFKLHSAFIDNGDDSRDYRPIKRLSDNKYGLWDKVHQTFNVSPNGVNFAGG